MSLNSVKILQLEDNVRNKSTVYTKIYDILKNEEQLKEVWVKDKQLLNQTYLLSTEKILSKEYIKFCLSLQTSTSRSF